jgi:hypothetical protein
MDLKVLIVTWLKDFFVTGLKAYLLKWLSPTTSQPTPEVDVKAMVYRAAINLLESLMAKDPSLQSHLEFVASMHDLNVDALELAFKKHLEAKEMIKQH